MMTTLRSDIRVAAGISYIAQLYLILVLLHSCCALQSTSLGVHVVRSPESAVAPKGDEVVFECELNLAPDRLDWRFRQSDSLKFRNTRIEDGFNITNEERVSKLRIYVSVETLGDYQCVAWFGSAAIASTSARLTLASIGIDNAAFGLNRSAIRWSLEPKNFLFLRCGKVLSNPPAIWSFYRNDVKISVLETQPLDGALILNSISAKDSGNYTCTAMNPITGREVRLQQRIDVRVDYAERRPPYFLMQPPSHVTARPGETVVLECPGVGSPPPVAVWSSPNLNNISNNRTKSVPYGLQIANVMPADQGTYVCRLDNGIAPVLVHIIKLNVLEKPQIIRGPATTLTNEGDSLELLCSALGNPAPMIYWLINGEDTVFDNGTFQEDRRLIIKAVQKRHAGIAQCFAKNEVGETTEGSLLQVNPKQLQGELIVKPLGHVPLHSSYEHSNNRNKGKRKHMKTLNMIPPSRPNVTRLSDDSVMLRWFIPKIDGPSLPIQFFKVQYRMVGDAARPRVWQTSNEDIPSNGGRRNQNESNLKNFTSSVSGLKPDRFYRFRIVAVYSNNDNKEGNTSAKFFLQRESELGESKSRLPPPQLIRVDGVSEAAVILHWMLPSNETIPSNLVDGFYAYYRPASSAGDYLKATVDGINARSFKIDMLDANTAYEFKLQSFNALAASEFSSIIQGKTKKSVAAVEFPPSTSPPINDNESAKPIYPIIAGAAGGGILLVLTTLAACLCIKKHKETEPSGEDKPQLNHIQADFVTQNALGLSTANKSGQRINTTMTITPNPLAQQESDKNRNAMELRLISTNNGGTAINNEFETGKTAFTDTVNAMQSQCARSTASCETLEACEGVIVNSTTSSIDSSPHLSLPTPTVRTKQTLKTKYSAQSKKSAQALTNTSQKPLSTSQTSKNHSQHHTPRAQDEPPYNLNNSPQGQFDCVSSHQPAYPGSSASTPSLLPKRMKQHHHHHHQQQQPQQQLQQQQQQQYVPSVPLHQNNMHHLAYEHAPSSPIDGHRRGGGAHRNVLQYPHAAQEHNPLSIDGLLARPAPSLRRTHRSSGNVNNNNGGVGIPIMMSGSGAACVQRSPMPSRSVKRLGSQNNENISSVSLNSIEV